MDLVKNKYAIAFLIIAAVAAIHYFFFYEKCEQPEDVAVAMIQLNCAYQVDPNSLRIEACQKLYGSTDCEFTEADDLAVIELFFQRVNNCTLATLKEQNLCTDKYEAL